ncbi:MAG: hypothetical protein WD448_12555, partial [Woeseia sp.]
DNVAHIVAIELLAAAQGIEFHHPQKSSKKIERIISRIRAESEPYIKDRSLSGDIARIAGLVNEGLLYELAADILPSAPR